MYARSTSTVAATSSIDRGLAYVTDELMSEIMSIDGCVGLSTLANRTTGRCISTSAWQSEEAMRASAQRVDPLLDEYVKRFGAEAPAVSEWEISVLHRDHRSMPGACARVSWIQGEARSVDACAAVVRGMFPALEELTGFCSVSLMINRGTGRSVSTVSYDSPRALTESRGGADSLRTQAARQAGAEVLDVQEFELAVAHLRVPELV